jgi:hypothetical protein
VEGTQKGFKKTVRELELPSIGTGGPNEDEVISKLF